MTPIAAAVEKAFAAQRVVDMHTHLFAPSFGHSGERTDGSDAHSFLLWGIDELLTYHYLIAELFRVVPREDLTPSTFFALDQKERAAVIWQHLFVDRPPVSEACRGVITTLAELGLDPDERDLEKLRGWFASQDVDEHVDRVMEISGVESITMTNEVFSAAERALWLERPQTLRDPRFRPVLRIDTLINDWPVAAAVLNELGHPVSGSPADADLDHVRRFLIDWIGRTESVYVAASLPPTFAYPGEEDDAAALLIDQAIMPALQETGLPLALMIGVERGVNPELRDAGDMVGRADVGAVARLCARHPDVRLLVTMLSLENQHELCVAARKFGNLTPFGCWWFLNTPTNIAEITAQRLELLGTSFIPQHSDARVLEQLVYKWSHSKTIISKVLTEQYERLATSGCTITDAQIADDVERLLRGNFLQCIEQPRRERVGSS